jgi:surface antigen
MINKQTTYYTQFRDTYGHVIYVEGAEGGASITCDGKNLRLHWGDWDELYRILNEIKAELGK